MQTSQQQEHTPTWLAVRQRLRGKLGEGCFDRWFEPVTGSIEEAENGAVVLRLNAPSKFHRNWINDHYSVYVQALWQSLAPGGQVLFAVEEEQSEPDTERKASAKVIQLDFWEDGKRAAPNAVFRSALFPALKSQKRKFIKEKTLCSVQGVTVIFTGEQFDQSDLDVYLEILNLARPFPLGTPVKFSAYSLLKATGHATGNTDHKWLHSVLIRLRGGTIDITDHKKRYFGGLIEGGFKDEITKHYEITINPKFAVLFGLGMWASIDKTQRQDLRRNVTAKALHAYYSTHAAPDAHSFDTLAGIAGIENSNERQKRATIIKAHKAMEACGFLNSYAAQGDTIKTDIRHTPGQLRHIAKRTKKKSRRPLEKSRDSVDAFTG